MRVPAPPPPPRATRVAEAGKYVAAVAAGVQTAVPGESALAARTAVAAAAAAGVLVVGRGVAVGPASAGVSGRPARHAARDADALIRIVGAAIDHRVCDGVVVPALEAGDSLPLGPVEGPARIGDVVGVRSAGAAGQLPGTAAPESEAVHAHGRSAQSQRAGDVHREDPTRRAVPGGRRQARGQRRRAVLRHADDLEGALTVGAVVGEDVAIGVEEPVSGAGAGDRQRGAHQRHGHDVLVKARVAQIRVAARVARDAAAVGARVRRIDVGILHLDHQKQVAGGDTGRGTARGADADRGRARGDRGGARIVRVDDAGQAARAVLSGGGAVDGGGCGGRREKESENQERPEGLLAANLQAHATFRSIPYPLSGLHRMVRGGPGPVKWFRVNHIRAAAPSPRRSR